ncbi:MCE family protein [Mycolicibacterium vaccae]|uniref:MCE family protein n=1 Tax=Mycolicibacterium vaccae TaxID=1810 RepID=UPI003D075164
MKDNLGRTMWFLSAFVVVCLIFTFALFAVFAELRFDEKKSYRAEFTNVTGLEAGNFVRIAGVEVGKVESVKVQPGMTVEVGFSADESVVLTEGTRATVRYDDLIGGRYLALDEGAGGMRSLPAGATIPLARTSPALDLDALIGGFRPLFRALNPEQINQLTSQLIRALQGQGDTIGSFFEQTAALTSTLADRDQLIGEVVSNLNVVLGSLGDQSTQFAKAVDSLSQMMATLSGQKGEIAASVKYVDEVAGSVADLLQKGRGPVADVVRETDRTAQAVLADHEYFDNLLETLPDAYKVMGRQGLYGDFFSFYLCDLVLKLNGKGGQPVYVKVAGQSTGRCAPK